MCRRIRAKSETSVMTFHEMKDQGFYFSVSFYAKSIGDLQTYSWMSRKLPRDKNACKGRDRENASHTITIGESDRGKEKEKNRSQRENPGKSSFPSTIPTSRTGIRFQTSPIHRTSFQPPQISQKCIKWTDDVVKRRNFLSSKNAKRISWCKWERDRERERERESTDSAQI